MYNQTSHKKKSSLCYKLSFDLSARNWFVLDRAFVSSDIVVYGSSITIVGVVSVFNDSSVGVICQTVKATSTLFTESVLPRNFGQDTTSANLCG